jgi:arsenate reductase
MSRFVALAAPAAEAAMHSELSDRPYNVLFLCTGNSARSILSEAVLNKIGKGKFVAYSAGSDPKGAVNPYAIALLDRLGFATDGLRSKSWNEFAQPGAPALDFVFTVCDNAANEVCPVWPGQPMTAHWGVPDPVAVEGDAKKIDAAFRDAFMTLQRRIELFTSLPIKILDRMSLTKQVEAIGKVDDDAQGQRLR